MNGRHTPLRYHYLLIIWFKYSNNKTVKTNCVNDFVYRVVESKHKEYKVGANVVGQFGWQLYTVVNPDNIISVFGTKEKPYVLPDLGSLPVSLALGALGMPG